MDDDFDLIRLRGLAVNIRSALDLLGQYDSLMLYTDNPMRRAQYQAEIQHIQDVFTRFRTEYNQLKAQMQTNYHQQLQEVQDHLEDGQTQLREKTIALNVAGKLNQEQLKTARDVLKALTDGQVPEQVLQETLIAVQHALEELHQRSASLPELAATDTEHLTEVVEAPKLDSNHKLKITIPIIPLILSYEAEVGLQSGLHLKEAWQRLLTWVRR